MVPRPPPRQVGLEGTELAAHLHFQQRPRHAAVGGCCPARLRPHTAACKRMRCESLSLPRQERRVLLWPWGLCGQALPRCPLAGPSAPESCACQGQGRRWADGAQCGRCPGTARLGAPGTGPPGSVLSHASVTQPRCAGGDTCRKPRSGPGRCGLLHSSTVGLPPTHGSGGRPQWARRLRAAACWWAETGPGHCPSRWGLHTDGQCHPEAGKAGSGRQVSSCRLMGSAGHPDMTAVLTFPGPEVHGLDREGRPEPHTGWMKSGGPGGLGRVQRVITWAWETTETVVRVPQGGAGAGTCAGERGGGSGHRGSFQTFAPKVANAIGKVNQVAWFLQTHSSGLRCHRVICAR